MGLVTLLVPAVSPLSAYGLLRRVCCPFVRPGAGGVNMNMNALMERNTSGAAADAAPVLAPSAPASELAPSDPASVLAPAITAKLNSIGDAAALLRSLSAMVSDRPALLHRLKLDCPLLTLTERQAVANACCYC